MYLNKNLKNLSIIFYFIINLTLLFLSFTKFPGQKIFFLTLFVVSNIYVIFSFKFSDLFFDKTLSIFLWLGFFYKLSILLITDSGLPEGRGNFSYLPSQYDEILIYSSIGIVSFFISSLIFKLFSSNIIKYKNSNTKSEYILDNFFQVYKNKILIAFFLLVSFVTIVNFNLGFYQKGMVAKYEINLYFGYFIKWMLLFGLTSISCLLIEHDLKKYKKITFFVLLLFFFELLMTNFSLLSRSLIFSGSAVLFATYFNYGDQLNKKILSNSLVINLIILFLIFSISIIFINKIRTFHYVDNSFIAEKIVEKSLTNKNKNQTKVKNDSIDIKDKNDIDKIVNSNLSNEDKIQMIENTLILRGKHKLNIKKNIKRILFIIKNRFVGLDGVATVVSYPNKNYKLFFNALKREYDSNDYSFYQKTFIIPFEQKHLVGKKYEKTSERHYGVILPGIISFLSYPGSKIFLSFSCFLIFLFCASIEIIAKKLSYNSIIFSSLVGYVMGYRLIHFGYLPKQSYLLIGAIILTISVIYLCKTLIIKYYNVKG